MTKGLSVLVRSWKRLYSIFPQLSLGQVLDYLEIWTQGKNVSLKSFTLNEVKLAILKLISINYLHEKKQEKSR